MATSVSKRIKDVYKWDAVKDTRRRALGVPRDSH